MAERTCAACDSPLDDNVVRVKLGGKAVEVCCEECAIKLKEAYVSGATADAADAGRAEKPIRARRGSV